VSGGAGQPAHGPRSECATGFTVTVTDTLNPGVETGIEEVQ
jgi:hypothetical protein